MFYRDLLRGADSATIAKGLIRLRKGMADAGIPAKSVGDCLLLATWNIREFGNKRPKVGKPRSNESLAYIAEILSRFDLVAIQEVRDDLSDLNTIRRALGSWWKYIVTDVTEGRSGNRERLAYLYDTRVVTFGGLAGEIVVPTTKKNNAALQFARTPFVCGFSAGWKRLELCTVHIYYGDSSKDNPRRTREIDQLAKFLAKRGAANQEQYQSHTVALGDFNIFNRGDETFTKLAKAGFTIPRNVSTRLRQRVAEIYEQSDGWLSSET